MLRSSPPNLDIIHAILSQLFGDLDFIRGVQPMNGGLHAAQEAMNATQHKIVNILKTFGDFFLFSLVFVFKVWPKMTFFLPVWPRDAKTLDTPGLDH